MKKKIISGIVEAIYVFLYVYNFADTLRSMGARVNHAIETLAEGYGKNDVGGFASYNILYSDLDQKFMIDGYMLAISTVILVLLTVFLYHINFNKKNND